jgi:hypothetical protein
VRVRCQPSREKGIKLWVTRRRCHTATYIVPLSKWRAAALCLECPYMSFWEKKLFFLLLFSSVPRTVWILFLYPLAFFFIRLQINSTHPPTSPISPPSLQERAAYPFKNTYSPITLANLSSVNLVSIFQVGVPVPHTTQCILYVTRCVDPSVLPFSLSSHRHSYIRLIFTFRFID